MPTVDMSLEKLRSYQGINPRPADFDEYWDRALAEMNAIDPAPVFTPADIPSAIADCYHLNFRSTKGANIYARFVKPKNISGKVPAVLMFHGLSGSCDSFSKMLNYASQGYVVAFLDSRGQGGTPRKGGDNKSWQNTSKTRKASSRQQERNTNSARSKNNTSASWQKNGKKNGQNGKRKH